MKPEIEHPKTMPNDKSPPGPKTAAQQETGGDCVSRLVQHLRHAGPCRCKYQTEKVWGYDLQKWVGGRKSWREMGWATDLRTILKILNSAKSHAVVLIRCRGCGADIIREYHAAANPLPNDKTEGPAA